MMKDELRNLVHFELPLLGHQIMKPVSEMPNSMMPKGRHNFVASSDWTDKKDSLKYTGPIEVDGSAGFQYQGEWPQGEGTGTMDQWYIGFYGFRSGTLDEIPETPVNVQPGEVRLVQVDKTANNGPGFIDYNIVRREEQDRSKERSIGAIAEAEYKNTMRSKVKAGIPGIGEAEVESTHEFRARVEAQAHDAWKESDTLENTVDAKYEVYPYHQLTVSVKRGNPKIAQKIPVGYGLECSVIISVFNAYTEKINSLAELALIWRGLHPGSVFSGYFSRNPADVEGWVLPKSEFDLLVTDNRVRYTDTQYDHVPIPGKEDLAKKYVEAKLGAI